MPPPVGATKTAASNGPNDPPKFPPTWNNDCANPRFPPDASEVNREASGWKTDEPIPTNATEQRTNGSVLAKAKLNNPTSVKLILSATTMPRAICQKKSSQRLTYGCSRLVDKRYQPIWQSSTLNLP